MGKWYLRGSNNALHEINDTRGRGWKTAGDVLQDIKTYFGTLDGEGPFGRSRRGNKSG